MRYVPAFPLLAASLIGAASIPECANAQSNQYPLDRLFLEESVNTPFGHILQFNTAAKVADYYGAGSNEAKLAHEFFMNHPGPSAHMLFTRYPDFPGRAHLYGGNISDLTLKQLQKISGSLSIVSQGYTLTGTVDLSDVKSFSAAASAINIALDSNLPTEAASTESSIAAASVSFTGSIATNVLNVNAVSSGKIQIGSIVNGRGVSPGAQIAAQLSGTPGGAGQYSLFLHGLAKNYVPVPFEAMTDTYGVLTIGSASSGSGPVAVGQRVIDTGPGGDILPHTAIEANLSGGSGAGSTWVVNKTQTVASEGMTMTAAPLYVQYESNTGVAGEKRNFFVIQQAQDFMYDSASLSNMTGSAATRLGLSKKAKAIVSSPGLLVLPGSLADCPSDVVGSCISAAEFMANLLTENDHWATFQDAYNISPAPGTMDALEAWASSTDGLYQFLPQYSDTTPPIPAPAIVDSLVSSAGQPFAASGATAPEPSTWAMVLLGFAGLGLARYRLKPSSWLSGRRIGAMDRTS